jgi:four helix bundle protein
MDDHHFSRRSNLIPEVPSVSSSSSPSPSSPPSLRPLPHQKLLAYQVALSFASAVREAAIREAALRDQALRAATSACLNTAEGATKVTPADRRRAFVIARGEACEAAAAVEIAVAAGLTPAASLPPVLHLADQLVALLTGLISR